MRELGVHPGVTLNPATSLETLAEVIPEVDLAVIMSVNPGFGGQAYIPASTEKIRRLRAMLDENGADGAQLEVDGGINVDTAGAASEAGASVLVAGAAVFRHPDGIAEAIRLIRRAAEEGGAVEDGGPAEEGGAGRSPMNEPSPPTLLAVLAHPDDEVLCAGTLLAQRAAGSRVVVLWLTRGK